MIVASPDSLPPADDPAPAPEPNLPPTPWKWRALIAVAVLLVGGAAYAAHAAFGQLPEGTPPEQVQARQLNLYRGQAVAGVFCFLGLAAFFSRSLQSVPRKTLIWGILLQFGLALAVIHSVWVQAVFNGIGAGIKYLIAASDVGAKFVFGPLTQRPVLEEAFGKDNAFIFAFTALPPILFVSSFFSVLYYFGVLQLLVRFLARVMMYLMGTSGAETLSVSANVFMGQTEAPLIVKPFVPRMTQSELLTMMASGMAHISGGMMAVYISYGADPAAILCTCVMACPCSLYLTKLVFPEAGKPETAGTAPIHVATPYVNAVDAAATGVKDGLALALNVAAMLIGFLAFIALFNFMIGGIKPALVGAGISADALGWWPDALSLEMIFGWVFAPVAFLLGVAPDETGKVGSLLGIKLAANEHVAYLQLKEWKKAGEGILSQRSQILSVYALTGFANFASVGIQLGGIGAIAPGRRGDLARLGMKALFVGFLATLLNAAVAGLLM